MAVTSAQLYAEADKIMGVVSQIEDAVSYLTQANNAVSVNQSGLIVETIKNNIGDKQTKLGTASTNLSAAAALLRKYAAELAEQERIAAERARMAEIAAQEAAARKRLVDKAPKYTTSTKSASSVIKNNQYNRSLEK